ncbi:MAG TPA: HAD-IC family P-type ATPase [Candidatus Saccharibacteria bacterium]|nr:HAD-IC family P-type ATPase [Candidatus Saccharibacteria bacterium]
MLFYTKTAEETLRHLYSSTEGISSHEAKKRLKAYGPNRIITKGTPLWKKLIKPFTDVFAFVLFAAVIISLIQQTYLDAFLIIVIILINSTIYYIQSFSTEKILRSLQKKEQQRVIVKRSGEMQEIDAELLVPGDIIQLQEGDKIPADIRIIEARSLRVSEAVLTGESEPTTKSATTLSGKKEVYEQTNMLFQGAFVVSGQAIGVVVTTANKTEFGKIAELASSAAETQHSPVQKKIDQLVFRVIIVITAVSVVAFALSMLHGTTFAESIRFVLALAVSAIPESLPIAISVILVLGMRRMARKRALVRNMRAIETVGVVTTIATDKTGTLTENKLSVQEIWQPQGNTIDFNTILYRATNFLSGQIHDPLDNAILQYVKPHIPPKKQSKPLLSLPFDITVSMSGNIWPAKKGSLLVVKGAPEKILQQSKLTDAQREKTLAALQEMTKSGHRVIALAATQLDGGIESFSELKKEQKFQFIGLVGVADTLRLSARRAIAIAQNAGVTVRMITGDHFETAFQIGKELGLVTSKDQVFDSSQATSMDQKELKKRVKEARVFSRITPENKYKILQILKIKEVTAMTGDGVNDVPALVNAHVGIAMGSGSHIAKDASDIILLNNNFASIVTAMREGRIIFANIRRMLFYLLSTNTGEVIVFVGALAIGMPAPLAAVQILWVNLVTDSALVIPLGLEPGEKDVMKRPPVNPKSPILNGYIISRIVLVALVMGVTVLLFYVHFSHISHEYAQTIAFTSLVVIQWANAFNARSTFESAFSRLRVMNRSFYLGLSVAIAVQLLVIFGPLQSLLHIHTVAFSDLATTSLVSFVVVIVAVEIHKKVGRRYLKK